MKTIMQAIDKSLKVYSGLNIALKLYFPPTVLYKAIENNDSEDKIYNRYKKYSKFLKITGVSLNKSRKLEFVINEKTYSMNMRPLLFAIFREKAEMATDLINHCKVKKCLRDVLSPLEAAIIYCPDIVETIKNKLKGKGGTCNTLQAEFLVAAKNRDHSECMRLLPVNLNPYFKDFEDRTAVAYAAMWDDGTILERLINSKNAHLLSEVDKGGFSPLDWAVFYNNYPAVNFMLNSYGSLIHSYRHISTRKLACERYVHPDVEKILENWFSSIHTGAEVSPLLKEEVRRNAVLEEAQLEKIDTKDKQEALYESLEDRRDKSLESLIEDRKLELNSRDKKGETPLMRAVKNNMVRSVERLLEKGADPNLSGALRNNTLAIACANNSIDMVNLLLTQSPKPTINERVIRNAIKIGNNQVKRMIFEAVEDPGKFGRGPVMEVKILGLENWENYLRDKNFSDGDKEYRLFEAICDKDEEMAIQIVNDVVLRDMIQFDRDPFVLCADLGLQMVLATLKGCNRTMYTKKLKKMILASIRSGNTDILKDLLSDHHKIDNDERRQFILAAIDSAKYKSLEYLLGKPGWSEILSSTNLKSRVPLIECVKMGDPEMVALLIEHGANVNCKSNRNETPLMLAILARKNAIINILEDNGAKKGRSEAELFIAAADGNISKVDKLLNNHEIDKNPVFYSRTPLSIAAERGHLEIVNRLLQSKQVLKDGPDYSISPLAAAAKKGKLNVVKSLILKKASLDKPDVKNRTPLILACANYHYGTAAEIFESGANPYLKDGKGRTALTYAELDGKKSLARNLMNMNCYEGFAEAEILKKAEEGDCQNIKTLLEKDVHLEVENRSGRTPLMLACEGNYTQIAELLLKRGASTFTRDNHRDTPLTLSVDKGHQEMVELLLKYGATTSFTGKVGMTPLMVAAVRGDLEIMQMLLEESNLEQKDKQGNTALIHAVKANRVEAIKKLHSVDALIDGKGNSGKTPLIVATEEGSYNLVLTLLDMRACPNVADDLGATPVIYACVKRRIDMVKELRKRGGKLDVMDSIGRTPLFISILFDDSSITAFLKSEGASLGEKEALLIKYAKENISIENLIKKGVNLNARMVGEDPPITIAIENQNIKNADLLISNGADPNIANRDGKTPLIAAVRAGFEKIVQKLLDHGAVDTIESVEKSIMQTACTLAPNNSIKKMLIDKNAMDNTDKVFKTTGGTHYHTSCKYPQFNVIQLNLGEALTEGLIPCNICIPRQA